MTSALEQEIEDLWGRAGELSPADTEAQGAVNRAIDLLDSGQARVAEVGEDGTTVVHEWLKKAILLLFRLRAIETIEVGPFEYADKLPLKNDFAAAGVRVVPGASARHGSYLAPGVILMPSYVNIGARVGEGTMVDTWATVGSCAQIGARVHLSGGVGIGGVLEPPNAVPVIVEDDAMVGSRCMVTQGAHVGQGAVLGEGTILNPTIPVIDADTGVELSRGVVPAWSVAVSAARRREFPGGEFFLPCVLVIKRLTEGQRHDKAQLNEVLRRVRRLSVSVDLLAETAQLVAVPSVSHHEGTLADAVQARLEQASWLTVEHVGDNVVGRTTLGHPRRLVVAGHLDTVPPVANEVPRVEGDVCWGLGSSDMKGGLAVMLALATTLTEPAVDVTWCFYAREEIGRDESGLAELWATRPDLLVGDAAVLGEPTDALVEAGCQGTMRLRLSLVGQRAHTARPFAGRNAIHRLAPVLEAVAAWESRRVVLDGCEYAEQLQAVEVTGGVAANVVPDHATVTLNYRFAPDRNEDEALVALKELIEPFVDRSVGDQLEVLDSSAGAPPSLDDPLLAALVARSGATPRAKVGWTDVASFFAHGVPAANFGPGDPLLAHHPDERVERSSLERAHGTLRDLLTAGG